MVAPAALAASTSLPPTGSFPEIRALSPSMSRLDVNITAPQTMLGVYSELSLSAAGRQSGTQRLLCGDFPHTRGLVHRRDSVLVDDPMRSRQRQHLIGAVLDHGGAGVPEQLLD